MKKYLILLSLLALPLFGAVRNFTWISKNVTTAATPVALRSTNLYVFTVTIQAKNANTGNIFVQSDSAASTERFQLTAGQSVTLTAPRAGDSVNLAAIFIDASVNGEGVIAAYQEDK